MNQSIQLHTAKHTVAHRKAYGCTPQSIRLHKGIHNEAKHIKETKQAYLVVAFQNTPAY